MTARPNLVPRGTDPYAPLIEAMTAQTQAITKLVEAMGALAECIAHPAVTLPAEDGKRAAEMMRDVHSKWVAHAIQIPPIELTQEQSDYLRSLNPGPADPNAAIGGPDPRRYGDEPIQTVERERTNAALADLAEDLGLYDEEPMPEPDMDSVWCRRLQLHGMKLWQPEWGPQPGQAGCEVPGHLLNGRSR